MWLKVLNASALLSSVVVLPWREAEEDGTVQVRKVGSKQIDQRKEVRRAGMLTRSMRAQQTMASTPVMRAAHKG